ncbi:MULTISPECIES: conjugative transfer protein MobI(A/C) [Delftia]|jgi:hypothetical protein|uniref:Uncharacterized protein n=1 Tax=Delftia lacustris TaxID=558537 RepID=A0A1H3N3J0_9BURK|nr:MULTISPECIES: conjugative transfer protein MobI(A/C) [Delftia]QPS78493.1 hypothetical protein I6G48_32780 [Delftia acidovorans]QPS85052.1 hypothetical protein I6G47_33455 [Delftia lacustris]SDY83521.1 hypothetical protein SAMN05421547_108161 [Delftia lacustris]
MEGHDKGIESLEAIVTDLYDEAMRIADHYWDTVTAHERRATGYESRSALELSCVKRGNNLQIVWKGIKWYGSKANRTRTRIAIARDSKNMTYTDAELKKHAKDWEWEVVRETELQMQSIRRQAYHLVRAIMSIRAAKAVKRVADEKLQKLRDGR